MKTMYDAIDSLEHNIPLDAQMVGYYGDGHYEWSASQIASRPQAEHIKIMAFTYAPDANMFDCEKGDFTEDGVVAAAKRQWDEEGIIPTIYCNKSTWIRLIPRVSDHPTDWFVADPDGNYNHILEGTVGTQWGWEAGYDISTVRDEWPRPPAQVKGDVQVAGPHILTLCPTPSNRGYWLLLSDGGVLTEGDATFWGSLYNEQASGKLDSPVAGMASTASGRGYWIWASGEDKGVFCFGDAMFFGQK